MRVGAWSILVVPRDAVLDCTTCWAASKATALNNSIYDACCYPNNTKYIFSNEESEAKKESSRALFKPNEKGVVRAAISRNGRIYSDILITWVYSRAGSEIV